MRRACVRLRSHRALGVAAASLLALAVGVGSATGRSAGTYPANVTKPTVSGTYLGQTLSATAGTWSSDTHVTTHLQWVRILPNGGKEPIAGATAPTYTVGPNDLGSHLQVQVKAVNAAGPTWVDSDPTAVVVGPPTTKLASGSTSVAAASVTLPDRFVVRSVGFKPSALGPGGTMTATVVVTDAFGSLVSGARVSGTVVPFDAAAQPAVTHTGRNGSAALTLSARNVPRSGGAALNVTVTQEGGDPISGVSASRLFRLPVRP